LHRVGQILQEISLALKASELLSVRAQLLAIRHRSLSKAGLFRWDDPDGVADPSVQSVLRRWI
jgi:hypothetical protein